jgi:hypothetical protein
MIDSVKVLRVRDPDARLSNLVSEEFLFKFSDFHLSVPLLYFCINLPSVSHRVFFKDYVLFLLWTAGENEFVPVLNFS